MRRCAWAYGSLALGLGLLTGAAEAQEIAEAMPGAPDKMLLAAAPPVSPQERLSEYGRSLEFIYAEVEELREQRSMSAAEILASAPAPASASPSAWSPPRPSWFRWSPASRPPPAWRHGPRLRARPLVP
jgi:hypothetical protein